MKGKLKIGILYLSFHNSLKKIHGINRVVTEKVLTTKLGRQYLVPRRLRVFAIKELIKMNLLKEVDKEEYKILDYELNVEEDANKFLKTMNLFCII